MIPLPEQNDSKLVIIFKLIISLLTVGILLVTSISNTLHILKLKNKKMGF